MAKKSSIAIDIEADARKAEQAKRLADRRKNMPKKNTKVENKKSKEITKSTKTEAYTKRPAKRANEVLEALGDKEMTARQVMQRLGYTDPNMVRPRLTELMDVGEVEVCGKALDLGTGRTVAMYRRVTDEV